MILLTKFVYFLTGTLLQAVGSVWDLCAQLSKGVVLDCSIVQIFSITTIVYEIFAYVLDLAEKCAVYLADYYIVFEAMAAALLEKVFFKNVLMRIKNVVMWRHYVNPRYSVENCQWITVLRDFVLIEFQK